MTLKVSESTPFDLKKNVILYVDANAYFYSKCSRCVAKLRLNEIQCNKAY